MPLEEEFDDHLQYSPRRRATSRTARAPALRSLVATVAWLDAAPQWIEGRVIWPKAHHADGRTRNWCPTRADLARTERALNQLCTRVQRSPHALERALASHLTANICHTGGHEKLGGSDLAHWLERQRTNLEAAKRLVLLAAPDLPTLVKASRMHNPKNAPRLTELLQAEVLCLNALPASPARALVAFGALAGEPLWKLATDLDAPRPARALAALVLGTLVASDPARLAIPAHRTALFAKGLASDAWLTRAYQWGQSTGLPAQPAIEPALLVRLLETPEGTRSIPACVGALGNITDVADVVPSTLLREWLARGVPVAHLPGLIVSAAPVSAVLQQLRQRPDVLPEKSHERRRVAREMRQQRQQLSTNFQQQLHAYWLANPDPAIPALLAVHAQAMLSVCEWHPCLAEGILRPLRLGQTLPPALQKPWLELLVKNHSILWDREIPRRSSGLQNWLDRCWADRVQPLHTILQRSRDPALAQEMLDLRLQSIILRHEWRDVALWQWLPVLSRDYFLNEEPWDAWSFYSVLSQFETLAQARATLGPLLAALTEASPMYRKWTLLALLDSVPMAKVPMLLEFVPYAPRLANYAAQTLDRTDGAPDIYFLTDALVQMLQHAAKGKTAESDADESTSTHSTADDVDRRFNWLLSYLLREERRANESLPQKYNLSRLVDVAWVITNACEANNWLKEEPSVGKPASASHTPTGDIDPFGPLLQVALRQPNLPYYEHLNEGLQRLAQFPVVGIGLYLLFERQPQRCLRLIDELGAATRMGEASLTPLEPLRASLETIAATAQPTPEWEELLRHTPQIDKPAKLYQFAHSLRGEETIVPAVLQRQLGAGARMQQELEHLEALGPEQIERPHIATRIANLRARLQDATRLEAEAAAQAGETLLSIAGESIVAAAEYLLQQCYRQRLELLVGRLPTTLKWTGDLTNAVLMSLDIESNRPLLRRLLRAYANGDQHWPHQHPVNEAFLRTLGERGINVEVWTSRFPWRFNCAGVAGKVVRLHLERDPLRILQMGNHFGTCLSRGGCNSFSAVTNAVEANKRVVYALDTTGHVVGRQLIGINDKGELVGFHVYTSLRDEDSNKLLRGLFRRYITHFAARCGLTLAHEGTVPTLFAREWYDDGIIDWKEIEMDVPARSSADAPSRLAGAR